MYEIELEEIEDMLNLFAEDEDKVFFIGQVNAYSETRVNIYLEISHRTKYAGQELVARYLEKIGEARLPVTEGDMEARKGITEIEDKLKKKKEDYLKLFKNKGYMPFKGTWKICE